MLAFAALTPHSPLLFESISQKEWKKVAETVTAFRILKEMIEKANLDTLIVCSPHGAIQTDAITIQVNETYQGDLSAFGDLSVQPHFLPDLQTIDQLQRSVRRNDLPITLATHETLDYGIAVPMTMLLSNSALRLIPITPAGFDLKTHFRIGEAMTEIIAHSPKRIGIIASAELSHRLSSDTPLGFSPVGAMFDATVKEAIETGNSSRLVRLDQQNIGEAGACGLSSIVLLLGALHTVATTPHVLAYEHPFGVGYLTVHFALA